MASADPLSSISLPKTAPSRKIGKNCDTKPAAPPMKIWVQDASKGCPAKAEASRAAAGATSRTLQPR